VYSTKAELGSDRSTLAKSSYELALHGSSHQGDWYGWRHTSSNQSARQGTRNNRSCRTSRVAVSPANATSAASRSTSPAVASAYRTVISIWPSASVRPTWK
jgi:hypothetical protein